ncbi:hypothetical protein BGW41_000793 [Actinomortierella wolfii]|nr:hypothetical protein BGW41_000793 [Actinomortierella wolfii]
MPPKKKSLAEQLADLSTAAPVDYDPEDMGGDSFKANVDAGSDVESQGSGDDEAGREHYVSMGKSQLRTKQFLLDDPKYKGKRISRKAALGIESDEEEEEEEEEEDEDDGDDDESDAEDDVMDEDELDDGEDLMGGLHDDDDDDEGEDEEEEGDGDDDDESEGDDDDEDEDEEDEEDGYSAFSTSGVASTSKEMQEELQKIQAEEKALLQRMTKSVNEDVEKGIHVKSQLTIWETLLDTRIRLQKSVALINTFPQPEVYDEFLSNDAAEPQEEAKIALRSLIDTLITVRTSLLRNLDDVTIPKANKRKHADIIEDEETRQERLSDDAWETKAWKDVEGLNEAWRSYRNNTLEKWSNKVQVASGIPLNKKFKAMNQGIMTQISQTMADEERLLKRTQLKRSEYHILGKPPKEDDENDDPSVEKTPDTGRLDAHLSNHDEEIFDDTDFYQQLLRELIESRMVDNDDPTATGMRWAALRQSKQSKKKVDTKASKGRRLRYHVHEKLQSFMAPVPAGTWHEEMVEELFSSLLGRKSELQDEDNDDEEEAEDEVIPDDGMRIFG